MKTLIMFAILLSTGLTSASAIAENKVFPIEAFESETLPIFSTAGEYIDEVPTAAFGDPSKVAVFGFDKRGFAIVEHEGSRVILDPAYIVLSDSFKKKARVKCAAVNKEKDSQYATSMGFGDCI